MKKRLICLLVALCLLGTLGAGFSAMAKEDRELRVAFAIRQVNGEWETTKSTEYSLSENNVEFYVEGENWAKDDGERYSFYALLLDEKNNEIFKEQLAWVCDWQTPHDFSFDFAELAVGKYSVYVAAYEQDAKPFIKSKPFIFSVTPAA